jgi:opacity protein-like surface antigen
MKKLFLLILIGINLSSAVNAQFTKIGGGIGYGTGYWFDKLPYEENRSGHLAFFAEGVYEITVPIHISASFSYFYPNKSKYPAETISVSSMMVDINGHYVFNSLDRVEVYGLIGLDILMTKKKIKYESGVDPDPESDYPLGLNVGAGTYFKISEKFDIFAEAKYIVSKYGQFMFNAGVFINVDWMKKHENDPE